MGAWTRLRGCCRRGSPRAWVSRWWSRTAAGASGNIGTEQAARATPDGYTLLINTNPLVTNGLLYAKLNYDTFTDFVPISLLCQSVSVMAINPRVPARNLQEFLDLARAKPGSLNFATAGPATNPHVGGELVNYLGKTNIVAVHFKGGGPALLATLAGDTECGRATAPTSARTTVPLPSVAAVLCHERSRSAA